MTVPPASSPRRGPRRLAGLGAGLAAPWLRWRAGHDPRWLALLARCEALREAAAHDRLLAARCRAPFISRALDLAARHEIVATHHELLRRRFPTRLRARLLQGRDTRIAHFALGEGLCHLHMRAPALPSSGELGLYLLGQDRRVLSSCTLTFAGRRGLLIGALHGSWPFMGKRPIAAFTRAAHGLRPKNLLLSLAYALGEHMQLEQVRAASDAARPAAGDRAWRGTGQDAFWIENGGRLDAEGFYLLPPAEHHRPAALVPSKRRAARRRREALRADVREQLLFALRYAQAAAPARPASPLEPQAGRRLARETEGA